MEVLKAGTFAIGCALGVRLFLSKRILNNILYYDYLWFTCVVPEIQSQIVKRVGIL
jgi:hypothetical protein